MKQIIQKDFLLFKALAHPIRLEIVKMLGKKGEMCACKIYEAFNISQPGISKQLSVLKECGILKDRRQGTWIHYSIDESSLAHLLSVIEGISQDLKEGRDEK